MKVSIKKVHIIRIILDLCPKGILTTILLSSFESGIKYKSYASKHVFRWFLFRIVAKPKFFWTFTTLTQFFAVSVNEIKGQHCTT